MQPCVQDDDTVKDHRPTSFLFWVCTKMSSARDKIQIPVQPKTKKIVTHTMSGGILTHK